jgi:quinol monooxygenase YgiN
LYLPEVLGLGDGAAASPKERKKKMLLLRETLSVTSSRQDDVIERVRGIHSYMLKHPGFLRGRIARYLGAPNEYLVLRLWREPEELEDYRTTQTYRTGAQTGPRASTLGRLARPAGKHRAERAGREQLHRAHDLSARGG